MSYENVIFGFSQCSDFYPDWHGFLQPTTGGQTDDGDTAGIFRLERPCDWSRTERQRVTSSISREILV